jgi:hypothetical protein
MSDRIESAWCCGCKASTSWKGRGVRLHCTGCGTDFPCAHACKHWDCLEAKGLAIADSNGVLRLVSAPAGPTSISEVPPAAVASEPLELLNQEQVAASGDQTSGSGNASAPRGTTLTLAFVVALASCASGLHEGPTALGPKESHALRHVPATPDGFEHFWVRPEIQLGAIRWSSKSTMVANAPAGLLERAREESLRLNVPERVGEATDLTVTIFSWDVSWQGPATTVGVEVLGRGDDGRILWMGVDRFRLTGAGEGGGKEVEHATVEIVRRIQRELHRARPSQSFGL